MLNRYSRKGRERRKAEEPLEAELVVLFGVTSIMIVIPWAVKDPKFLFLLPVVILVVPGLAGVFVQAVREMLQLIRDGMQKQQYGVRTGGPDRHKKREYYLRKRNPKYIYKEDMERYNSYDDTDHTRMAKQYKKKKKLSKSARGDATGSAEGDATGSAGGDGTGSAEGEATVVDRFKLGENARQWRDDDERGAISNDGEQKDKVYVQRIVRPYTAGAERVQRRKGVKVPQEGGYGNGRYKDYVMDRLKRVPFFKDWGGFL